MILYNAKGEAFKVPHKIDVKDWLATGKYFKVNPKAKKEAEAKKEEY